MVVYINYLNLTTAQAARRLKEVGMCKIMGTGRTTLIFRFLGASTRQIIVLLSRNILLLVLNGAVIASLASYYAMDKWLTGFAYHTGINPLVFLASAEISAGVAFITVAVQSNKTAQANPVNALRYE